MFRFSHIYLMLIITAGCRPSISEESSKKHLESNPISAKLPSGRLVRELGSIRVNSQHTVTFEVKNDTNTKWTISQFDTTCACTVMQASTSVIKPKTTETIKIKYRAPSKFSDEYRQVGVKFKEGNVPYLFLTIKASVRPEADAFPSEINLQRVARGQYLDTYFEVRNFSDANWASIVATCDESWVKTSCVPVPFNLHPGSPRQKWRVMLRGNTMSLAGGSHKFVVHVIPSNRAEPLVIPVTLDVLRPVVAIPDQVFIPSAEPGKTVQHKLSLRFANEQTYKNNKKIEVSHNLPGQFKITCNRLSDINWEVCTEWTVDQTDNGIISGNVTLKFGSTALPDLTIPVYARVSHK